MNKRLSLILIFQVILISLFAQTSNLSQNAWAIVNEYTAVFSQTDVNNATYKVTKKITILNKQGEGFAHFYSYGDKFTELKDFSGIIKNSTGAVMKKIGKKDLTISSFSEHFSTDNYSIYYICKQPTYPYTVEYTYEQKWKNGIIAYPPFAPISNYMQAVEKANYSIELPENIKVRFKSNYDCDIKEENVNGKHLYKFSAQNLNAINYEPQAPPFKDIAPSVTISPSDFCFDSSCGNMADWNSYSRWVSTLLKDRDILPADFTTKLLDLTKDAKTDREKTEILYKYLQDNFRYVSIQLGIGGFQPIEAASTAKSKFGDCKGLTNLMKAMLNAVGIDSNYCEIYMGNQKHFYKDFSNINQTNHVILLVPLKNDSIWLECTSQKLPFGYIHRDIAGHDALVVTENGGKVCRLPSYTDQQNKQKSTLLINISEDGTASGDISIAEHLFGYDNYASTIMSKDREKINEYINSNISMPKLQLGQFNVSEEKSEMPFCMVGTTFNAPGFANKTGTRLFIPICPLKKSNYNIFSAAKRELDIDISYGFSESDSIIINIPDSYTSESLPKDVSINTDFGTFSATCSMDGNKITYIQNIDIFSGRYYKSRYQEIKDFFSKISSAIKRKVVLKKS